MQIDYHKNFIKTFSKLNKKQQVKVKNAIAIFLDDPDVPSLRHHQLIGELRDVWSISAGGDLRIHYKKYQANEVVIIFIEVGTHSQLY